MHEYRAHVSWSRGGAKFSDLRYSRAHEWSFDGGVVVPASSSPSVVPLPLSVEQAVDPEEALVAAASSCHMLSFLYFAAKQGFVVESYADDAVGVMSRNDLGKQYISLVTLHPVIAFSGKSPTAQELKDLHHIAHSECYIANSLKCHVVVEGMAATQA